MTERERLSEEAYERKKQYNREYKRAYISKNNLVTFGAEVEANTARELSSLLAVNKMTRKDFILWAYDKLKQES